MSTRIILMKTQNIEAEVIDAWLYKIDLSQMWERVSAKMVSIKKSQIYLSFCIILLYNLIDPF